jgi:hypothetical protein
MTLEKDLKNGRRHWSLVAGKRSLSDTERGLDEFRKLRAREAEEAKADAERKRGAAAARRILRSGVILGNPE